MSMENKIKNIGKIFKSTFLLYSVIDTTLPQEKYVYIPKQDRRMMKMLYELYDMGRFSMNSYDVFEGMVIRHALNTNNIPIVACNELCEKSNDE